MRTTRFVASALCAAALAAAAPARADGLALDRFDPAPTGDRMLSVPSPFVAGRLTPHLGAYLDYAHNPLVLRTTNDNEHVASIVAHQLYLHLNLSLALFNRLLVNVDVPLAVFQEGESRTDLNPLYKAPSGVQIGDLRFGL